MIRRAFSQSRIWFISTAMPSPLRRISTMCMELLPRKGGLGVPEHYRYVPVSGSDRCEPQWGAAETKKSDRSRLFRSFEYTSASRCRVHHSAYLAAVSRTKPEKSLLHAPCGRPLLCVFREPVEPLRYS